MICSARGWTRSSTKHELAQLAGKIDWDWIDREPLGIETRFAIGLFLLKHIYGLSDEAVCERWVSTLSSTSLEEVLPA